MIAAPNRMCGIQVLKAFLANDRACALRCLAVVPAMITMITRMKKKRLPIQKLFDRHFCGLSRHLMISLQQESRQLTSRLPCLRSRLHSSFSKIQSPDMGSRMLALLFSGNL